MFCTDSSIYYINQAQKKKTRNTITFIIRINKQAEIAMKYKVL